MTVDEDIDRFLCMCETITAREGPNWETVAMAKVCPNTGKDISDLPLVFPLGPLNLNPDGSTINFKKSHVGPNAAHWQRADGEEMQRLLDTDTIRPINFSDIPLGRVVTYVNPVCVEKLNDNGSIKFRTRLTIGGDRIIYPFDKSAVTAEMDALKILLNIMISEDAKWSTIDLTDFYLGTDLPHPEYIRIPLRHIPQYVIDMYNLDRYIVSGIIYCSVHKTHYGLPQAGALSQQRLFKPGNNMAITNYQVPRRFFAMRMALYDLPWWLMTSLCVGPIRRAWTISSKH